MNDENMSDEEMAQRLRGRLMQAEMDLYRIREFSVAKTEKMLADEVQQLTGMIEYMETK